MPIPITLVTGASTGIGAALARTFARNGHELVLTARREANLIALADMIESAGYKRPHVLPADLGDNDAPSRISDQLSARGLEPSTVVNSAGFGLYGPATDLDLNEQLAMINLNVRILTDLSLRWVDTIAKHKGGILNVGSIAGFLPGPGMAVYHATKSYALSFSEALHRELKPRGIRVTVLCPGPVATEFLARSGTHGDHFPRFLFRSPERVARDGYAGFERGQAVVVPGFHNKVVTWLPRVLPRRLLRLVAQSKQVSNPTLRNGPATPHDRSRSTAVEQTRQISS